jgi:beta-1,4-mannosyltransferase
MKRAFPTEEIQDRARVQSASLRDGTAIDAARPGKRGSRYLELALTAVRVIRNEGWKSFFGKTWKLISGLPGYVELVYFLRGVWLARGRTHHGHGAGTIRALWSPHGSDNPELDMIINSLENNGISVYVAKTYNLFSLIKSIGEDEKPDVIHLHWAHYFTFGKSRATAVIRSAGFLLELLVLKLCRIKIVWTIHNIISHESKYPRWELFVNRRIAGLCNELIVHTDATKLEVRAKYRLSDSKPVSVVYPVNYALYYENSISRTEARGILSLGHEDFVFLFFGAVRAYKGLDDLIDRFNELRAGAGTGNVKLLIAGKPFDEEIREDILGRCAANKNIIPVLRWVEDGEIQIYMNAADVAVFPFENVLNSGSVPLAMAFSKPVIAPAMGSIPEILAAGGGFTYTASRENGLLQAMEQALKCERNELKAMGDANYERIKEFTAAALAARTQEIYRRHLKTQEWTSALRMG